MSTGQSWLWWQRGLIYQIYPRSFMDGNGDGVGDLPGIRSRLDYLTWLGVDAIWISPIFPSPMADFGYDVSDYTGVEPLFGSLGDFDALLAASHQRNMRLLLDFVPNHTSDRHPWFVEARSSKSSPRRDWYLWRDPAPDGGPPNNWLSVFGGSAWEWDEPTGQFYYHAYLKEQPDLNWRYPAVRAAMLDVLRFWLDRGVDGFRIDALRQLVKDDQFRDNPPDPDWRPGTDPYHALLPLYTTDRPEVMEIIGEWRALTDRYPDTRAHRRAVPAARAAGPLLRRAWQRPATAVQLPSHPDPLAAAPGGRARRPVRGAAAAERVAELRARQPRPAAAGQPRRARSRRGWRPCCCSPCAARPPSIRATSWACTTCPSRPSSSRTRPSATCPGSGSGATRSARPCSGTPAHVPASRPARPGCRWPRMRRASTSSRSSRTRGRRCPCTAP